METDQPGAQQPGPPSPQGPLRVWQHLSWRWKMTLAGAVMGAISSGLWTAPAAYYALRGGYMTHGIIYAAASILGVVGMAGLMHFLGIRQEKQLNATD